MRFTLASATLAAALASVASAANTIQVQVGQGALAFTPSSVNATTGDMIQFIFNPKNHTVTQSTFAAPCQAMANGIDSGFMPVAANATQVPSMMVTINSTDPVWFYCRQPGHCGQGMVFAVNPTANKSFAAFQSAAKGSSTGTGTGTSGSSTAGSTSPTTTPDGSGGASAPSASASTTSNGKNGAVAIGAQAGSLLAVVGVVAGLLL